MKAFLVLMGLMGLIGPAMASAFTLISSSSSSFQGWPDPHLQLQLNLSNCPSSVDVEGIMKEAADVWNHVASSRVEITVDGTTSSTTYGDPVPVVCDTNYGSGNPGMANGSPGSASVQPTTGDFITSGIMYLNASGGAANIGNLDRKSVAITLAHEIGHLLGLGHSQDIKALMYYDASLKTSLNLAQDDIDGITYLYPRNEFDGDPLAGCGRISDAPFSDGGRRALVTSLLLLLPLLAAFLRARTQSPHE